LVFVFVVNICFIHRFDTVEKYMAFAN